MGEAALQQVPGSSGARTAHGAGNSHSRPDPRARAREPAASWTAPPERTLVRFCLPTGNSQLRQFWGVVARLLAPASASAPAVLSAHLQLSENEQGPREKQQEVDLTARLSTTVAFSATAADSQRRSRRNAATVQDTGVTPAPCFYAGETLGRSKEEVSLMRQITKVIKLRAGRFPLQSDTEAGTPSI